MEWERERDGAYRGTNAISGISVVRVVSEQILMHKEDKV